MNGGESSDWDAIGFPLLFKSGENWLSRARSWSDEDPLIFSLVPVKPPFALIRGEDMILMVVAAVKETCASPWTSQTC